MNIKEVIDHCILAIFSDKRFSEKLFLKGGSGIRLLENIDTRLSTDIDFSIQGSIKSESSFFKRIEKILSKYFKDYNLEVFQFKHIKRPKMKKPEFPEWWVGWLCEFKLIPFEFKHEPKEVKERRSLMPVGSKSTIIEIEISESEYCELSQTKTVKGIKIQGYSKPLLVLEKIRALCQQHPLYKFRTSKNRARDFYDIYKLTENMSQNFLKECHQNIAKVFKAKEVPLEIIQNILNDRGFIENQKQGFFQVQATVSEKLYPFETYLESFRSLIQALNLPAIPPVE